MHRATDEERTSALLLSARQGDAAALERLFARYIPLVSRMVALRLGVPAAGIQAHEDLVQEALLSAVQSLDSFEYRGEGSFRNWMAGIVTHRIRDDIRRRTTLKRSPTEDGPANDDRSERVALPPQEDSGASPSEWAMRNEFAERVERALLDLGERYRRVYELRRLAGMSYDDIAVEMGLSGAASARALFARTLNMIADIVERGE